MLRSTAPRFSCGVQSGSRDNPSGQGGREIPVTLPTRQRYGTLVNLPAPSRLAPVLSATSHAEQDFDNSFYRGRRADSHSFVLGMQDT
jgi:hypothetical protein